MKQINNLALMQDKFKIMQILVGKYRHMYFSMANRLVNGKLKWKKHTLKIVLTIIKDDQ